MKIKWQNLLQVALCTISMLVAVSCKKESNEPPVTPNTDYLSVIKQMGFNTNGVIRTKDGYIVEGDIFIADSLLSGNGSPVLPGKPKTEQYRTTSVLSINGTRTVTISVSGLSYFYVAGVDEAISRYNALGLKLNFQRISSGGEIVVSGGTLPANVYARTPFFPSAAGDPGNSIIVDEANFITNGVGPTQEAITSIIAHEIGHAIGFRHTDYYDRNYSCGYSTYEPGADNIPGTPTYATADSWMLACIGNQTNRPFTPTDKAALNSLYGNNFFNGRYIIRNVNSYQFLAIGGAATYNGAGACQWPYTAGQEQKWHIVGLGGNVYHVINVNSQQYLAVRAGSQTPGADVLQWPATNGAEQEWTITQNTDGSYNIINRNSGQALAIGGGSMSNGATACQWWAVGTAEQRWEIFGTF
ncbi:M57 family metalloprotease [Chitinophaga flava]|uniref:Ricin B lectin domain-containing protein n=1 Tax=Chitinophaga flava TaxID=2259036 RepID=A0A365Y040_9BACT|nr:M57 family metalloprotease [Chitinophaga flava]RBL91982.1 hypothetical protein DF182_05120 [Chitinophaga flava]